MKTIHWNRAELFAVMVLLKLLVCNVVCYHHSFGPSGMKTRSLDYTMATGIVPDALLQTYLSSHHRRYHRSVSGVWGKTETEEENFRGVKWKSFNEVFF